MSTVLKKYNFTHYICSLVLKIYQVKSTLYYPKTQIKNLLINPFAVKFSHFKPTDTMAKIANIDV